jgi:hypothetical protein
MILKFMLVLVYDYMIFFHIGIDNLISNIRYLTFILENDLFKENEYDIQELFLYIVYKN